MSTVVTSNQLYFRQLDFVAGRSDKVGWRVGLDGERGHKICRSCRRWRRGVVVVPRCPLGSGGGGCGGPLVQCVAKNTQHRVVLVVELLEKLPQQLPDSLAAAGLDSKPLVVGATRKAVGWLLTRVDTIVSLTAFLAMMFRCARERPDGPSPPAQLPFLVLLLRHCLVLIACYPARMTATHSRRFTD